MWVRQDPPQSSCPSPFWPVLGWVFQGSQAGIGENIWPHTWISWAEHCSPKGLTGWLGLDGLIWDKLPLIRRPREEAQAKYFAWSLIGPELDKFGESGWAHFKPICGWGVCQHSALPVPSSVRVALPLRSTDHRYPLGPLLTRFMPDLPQVRFKTCWQVSFKICDTEHTQWTYHRTCSSKGGWGGLPVWPGPSLDGMVRIV